MTPVDIDKLKELVKRFPDDVTDVQSRIILAHQLRASADIQDAETKRRTGWADTTDRAERDRIAATAIELLDAALIAKAERVDALEAALRPFAERYTVAEIMAGAEDREWLEGTPERRIEMIGERKRAHDAAIMKARELLGIAPDAARNALSPKPEDAAS